MYESSSKLDLIFVYFYHTKMCQYSTYGMMKTTETDLSLCLRLFSSFFLSSESDLAITINNNLDVRGPSSHAATSWTRRVCVSTRRLPDGPGYGTPYAEANLFIF